MSAFARRLPQRIASLMHCMTVSLTDDGAGLGTVWGGRLATSMLADAGFTDVTVAEIEWTC